MLSYDFTIQSKLRKNPENLKNGFITAIVVNAPESKLAKRTFVHCLDIIITCECLQRAAGELHAANHVSILYCMRAIITRS